MPSRSGRLIRSQRGAGRVGCLLTILVVVIVGYFAVQFAGNEIAYRSLTREVQDNATRARDLDDRAIRSTIAAYVQAEGLPPGAGQVAIRRLPGDRIQVTVQYPDTLSLFDRWHWVRNRRVHVDVTY